MKRWNSNKNDFVIWPRRVDLRKTFSYQYYIRRIVNKQYFERFVG